MKKQIPVLDITRNQAALAILLCFGIEMAHGNPFPNEIDPDSVYVVVNSTNPQTHITQAGLNAIFNMRLRHWYDESPVTVYVLQDDDSLHKTFCKLKLHVFPHQLRKGWNRQVFSGTGQAPLQIETKADMLKRISETPGAIGYLPGKDLTADVKILEID